MWDGSYISPEMEYIKYEGKVYKKGDKIMLNVYFRLIFWNIPIKKEFKVWWIRRDGSAVCERDSKEMLIFGSPMSQKDYDLYKRKEKINIILNNGSV